jgi:hypothetical protein
MEKKGRNLGDQVENEEELLNFDLDELSTQDLDQMSFNSDDEIIELTELVEKGPGDEETRAMDGSWRTGSPSQEIEPGIDFSTNEIAKAMDGTPDESSSEDELDLSELSLELDLKDKGEGKPEPEPKGYEGEITADELDRILEERPLKKGVEMVEEPQQEAEPEGDIFAADLEGLLDESSQEDGVVDLGEEAEIEEPVMSVEEQRAAADFLESAREDNAAVALEPEEEPESERETQAYIDMENLAPPPPAAEPEPDDTAFEPTSPESVGISEEKIEAAITRAVEDVAERVIRETVAEVAERVLNEVIDALKKSLESSSE